MSGVTIPILKFVGTVSLGLLTGVSYTTTTQSLPALYTLPSASAANATFKHHFRSTTVHLLSLSALTTTCYALAYAFSPGRRHPYLLYTMLTVGAGAGVDLYMTGRDIEQSKASGADGEKVEEEDYEDVNGSVRLNGEEVRKSMEGWRLRQMIRGGVDGFAFTMAIIGLWGDGRL